MMKGLTACLAILLIAGACYVGSYVYFREKKAIKNPVYESAVYDAIFGKRDKRLGLIYTPMTWLDEKLTGTTIRFVTRDAQILL